MRSVALRVWIFCWLVFVWILLWGTFSAANVLSGAAVAALITWLLPLPAVPVEGKLHVLSLIRLLLTVAYRLVLSSGQVAMLAVKPRPPLSAVLRAQLSVKSDLVLSLAVVIFNLIPGSIVLEIDQTRRLLYMHVIDVGSDRALQAFYHQVAVIERLLVAAFERPEDWRPAHEHEEHQA
ncbi:Na+/H+ antiporter subunit E [Mycobacterium neumannii]|uniref:Na+/H+ antiporter subunit E n=1 Tax=Mycobacterium neumannii TaxID=2048551 RepID=UPI003AB67290